MTPKDAAREILRRASALKAAARKTQIEMAKRAVEEGKALSMGNYKTATLRKLGHPYSKANNRPPQPGFVINKQSGLFYRSWRRRYETTGNVMTATIWNASPEAVFLDPKFQTTAALGIPRPVADAITLSIKHSGSYPHIFRARVREALQL